MTQNFAHNIHLASPVVQVKRREKKVELTYLRDRAPVQAEFDEVIFACHADTTLKILEDAATPQEREVLGGFSYRPNDVTLHTDESVLPANKAAHASWNYFLPREERERIAVTYHMNILQGIRAPEKFLVSLNMDDMIDPAKVIKKIAYSHPVYTIEALHAQKRWREISGQDRFHFCGAYWGNGFHEDGVTSALKVAQDFGVRL
jgi:predicted NAD/FAD-binding protein